LANECDFRTNYLR